MNFNLVYSHNHDSFTDSDQFKQLTDTIAVKSDLNAESNPNLSENKHQTASTTISILDGAFVAGLEEFKGGSVKIVYSSPKNKEKIKNDKTLSKSDEILLAENVKIDISEQKPIAEPKNLNTHPSKGSLKIGDYNFATSVLPIVVKTVKVVAEIQKTKIKFPGVQDEIKFLSDAFVIRGNLYASSFLLRGPPAFLV